MRLSAFLDGLTLTVVDRVKFKEIEPLKSKFQVKSPDKVWNLNPIFWVASALRKAKHSDSKKDLCVPRSCEVAISAVWSRRDFLRPQTALPVANRLSSSHVFVLNSLSLSFPPVFW